MKSNKMDNNKTSIFTYLYGWTVMYLGSLSLNDWAVVIGMLATIFGFLITWYYKHQEFKLKKQNFESNKNGNQKKNRK
ncbi:HP1 family phage holin [Gilliamella apicola]|uniref:HP1 family phage holin n=1 Tax=Gilliamella sp. wkB178 TaxID=3120259 RepID=UPI001C400F3D